MKIGVVGPSDDAAAYEAALSTLLRDGLADQVVFLGDGPALDLALDGWSDVVDRAREVGFLDQAARLASAGTPDEIHALLDAEDGPGLGAVRKLPAPPARAVEFVDDRIVLFVHDKGVLDEDDIANASLVVHAVGGESEVKRFGRRAFATPGPLSRGHLLLIEPGAEGLVVSVVGIDGQVHLREALGATQGRLTVA